MVRDHDYRLREKELYVDTRGWRFLTAVIPEQSFFLHLT